MVCEKCGKDVVYGAKYCIYCGAKVKTDIYCPRCDTKLPGDAKFCLKCGTEINEKIISFYDKYDSLCPKEYYKNKIGDTIKLGKYLIDDTNVPKDIEWIILDKRDGAYLLLSKYAIDYRKYNDKGKNITWKNSSIRKWLNTEFFNIAFSDVEKKTMNSTFLNNECNYSTGTPGGDNTIDLVYLFSFQEVEKYIKDDDILRCEPTIYANTLAQKKEDATMDELSEEGKAGCVWYLRSPGYRQDTVTCINRRDYLDMFVDREEFIRPVISFIPHK